MTADLPEPLSFDVGDAAVGARLDAWLTDQVETLSRSQAGRAISAGRVRVNGSPPTKAGQKLRAGDRVAYTPEPPAPSELVAQDIPLDMLHVDAWLAVVNKPPGLVVHPAAGHPDGTLVNAMLHHLGPLTGGATERPGIVHRLDKDTSGVLVVARDEVTHRALSDQFREHTTRRRYVAVVLGPRIDDHAVVETLYGRHATQRLRFSGRVRVGKRACTRWWVVARSEAMALLVLQLETGRTHQIRVHLAEAGHPVVGDGLYGRKPPSGGGGRLAVELAAARRMPRQALHAATLGFVHPHSGAWLDRAAPLPPDLSALVTEVFGPDALGRLDQALQGDQNPMPPA